MKKVYTSMIRQNMRHRGPIESKKINRFQLEVEENIKVLHKELERIDDLLKNYESGIDDFIQYEKELEYMQMKTKQLGGFKK